MPDSGERIKQLEIELAEAKGQLKFYEKQSDNSTYRINVSGSTAVSIATGDGVTTQTN